MSEPRVSQDHDPERPPPRPAWVKALVLVVALIAVVLVVSRLFGVEHGPSRHGSPGLPSGPESSTASSFTVLTG